MSRLVSSWLAAVGGLTLASICAHAQPSAEDARLRAYELAALIAICAHAQPGALICGLPEPEAVALAIAAKAAARARPEAGARERASAEAAARPRAGQVLKRRTPTDRDLWLIAPPGFGPNPTDPLK